MGLTRDPREVPSPLIGKPAPAFKLEQLHEATQAFSPEDMKGKVWMLNVWASWCVSCRVEHPLLVEMSQAQWRSRSSASTTRTSATTASSGSTQFGNPYALSAFDVEGRVGIDYGVYGVPETFVIDKQGVIRYKQIGPITPEALREDPAR